MISGIDEDDLLVGILFEAAVDHGERCEMPICGAARPMPCAAYIDSNISSTSFFSFGVEDRYVFAALRQHRVGPLYDLMYFAH